MKMVFSKVRQWCTGHRGILRQIPVGHRISGPSEKKTTFTGPVCLFTDPPCVPVIRAAHESVLHAKETNMKFSALFVMNGGSDADHQYSSQHVYLKSALCAN